jgi:peptide methionine sulfoxide reductase msrA/msrB
MILSRGFKMLMLCTMLASSYSQAEVAGMPATSNLATLVVGAGCFWGVEKRFEAIDGVVDAVAEL